MVGKKARCGASIVSSAVRTSAVVSMPESTSVPMWCGPYVGARKPDMRVASSGHSDLEQRVKGELYSQGVSRRL